MKEAVIVSGVRTASGNYGGALQDTPVVKMGGIVIKEAMKRAGLRPVRGADELDFAPEKLRDENLIELEKQYADWDDSLRAVTVDEVMNEEISAYQDDINREIGLIG